MEPYFAAANSSFACVSDAVRYGTTTSSMSMGESTWAVSSRGLPGSPRRYNFCMNREGNPCTTFSRRFSVATWQSAAANSATGMHATSCPDIILTRNISADDWDNLLCSQPIPADNDRSCRSHQYHHGTIMTMISIRVVVAVLTTIIVIIMSVTLVRIIVVVILIAALIIINIMIICSGSSSVLPLNIPNRTSHTRN